MFRPILFLVSIRLDTIIGKTTHYNMIPTLMVILYHIIYCVVFSDKCIQPDDGKNSIGRNM